MPTITNRLPRRIGTLCLLCVVLTCPACRAEPNAAAHPFFAMDTAMRSGEFRDPASGSRLLKEMGYQGVAPSSPANLSQWIAELDKHNLKMYAMYMPVFIDDPNPTVSDEHLEAMKLMKSHGTIVWLPLRSKRFKPSATDGDVLAVKMIRKMADEAARQGLSVSIYPHVNFYVQRIDDAIRVIEQADRKNVGLTFNLCHWLKTEPGADLRATLTRAAPYLNLVTINGADKQGQNWDRLIQPLGQGDYDVKQVLVELRRIQYTGPVGFQGFGIRKPSREILQTTIDAWRKYQSQMKTAK